MRPSVPVARGGPGRTGGEGPGRVLQVEIGRVGVGRPIGDHPGGPPPHRRSYAHFITYAFKVGRCASRPPTPSPGPRDAVYW